MTFLLPELKEKGYLKSMPMTICSVGSRKLSDAHDYGSQDWELFAPNLTIYGFDADADACEFANADIEARQVSWKEKHFPYALANKIGEATLYVTNSPICSSLYPPNDPFLNRFLDLPEMAGSDFSIEIETTTLDAICQEETIAEIDFLQIDVQGADLQVLEGAANLLDRSVFAIQIEVEFSELYLNQPLFADVDSYLRKKGFVLFELEPMARRFRSSLFSTRHPGQVLWADAIYLRDPLQDNCPDYFKQPDQLFKLACIADVLDFTDYEIELLEFLTVTYGKSDRRFNLADLLVSNLAKVPELVQAGLESLPTVQRLQNFLTQPIADFCLPTQPPTKEPRFSPPIESFHSDHYLRHNQRRLEHLASLGLNLTAQTVLEVGAGIGDHTSFFLDRQCQVTSTEGRLENLTILQQRYPDLPVRHLDLNEPNPEFNGKFDIVYCYGLLYHLHQPENGIAFMATHCQHLLLLETCVSFGEDESVNPCSEPADSPTQSVSGQGCRPTRCWILNRLKQHFPYVYFPTTQPNHEEFPLDWTNPSTNITGLTRAVFVASRQPLNNPLLTQEIPLQQQRH